MAEGRKSLRNRPQTLRTNRDRQFRRWSLRVHRSGYGSGMARRRGIEFKFLADQARRRGLQVNYMTKQNGSGLTDHELGMDRAIPRRDFLNGAAMTIGAAMLPAPV